MAEEEAVAAATDQPSDVQFALQRIYIKDASFESPRAPEAFREEWKPRINLELNASNKKIEDDLYEVVLSITVTAKNKDDEVAFLIEVQQGGIFLIKNMEAVQLHQTLGSFCPSVLFPYARETIDSMASKGSFPPLMLAPVNFDALYAESLRRRAEAQKAGEEKSEGEAH